MAYSPFGPFTNAGPPGIQASFLNNLETFLQSINGAGYDPHISADGLGDLTIAKLLLTIGSLSRIGILGGSAAQTVAHNWGVNPDIILPAYSGNFGSAPTHPLYGYSVDTNNIHVVGDTGYSWLVLIIKV